MAKRGPKPPTFAHKVEEFFGNVQKSDGCWNWIGTRNKSGYGIFYVPWIETRLAHRIALMLQIGNVNPPAVCHKCDNPSCVRPSHLFIGTRRDNNHDAIQKGRHAHGSKNGHAKLTESDVSRIFELKNAGIRHRQIAAQFGISEVTVSNIVHRKIWRHVEWIPTQ